ncbi:MAG: ABC transporter permease [Acidobacteriaceae bacterium]
MLRNILHVAKREYLERVRSRIFRVTTVLVPIGVGALLFIGQRGDSKLDVLPNLAIVSNNPALAAQVKAALLDSDVTQANPPTITVEAPETTGTIDGVNRAVAAHQIAGYLRLETQPGRIQPEATWVSTNSVDFMRKSQMQSAVRRALMSQELLARGISPERVHDLMKNVTLTTMKLKNGVAAESNSERSFAGAYALIIVLYGAVLIYGINIARSVVEEKTSRIFEVLLSTVSSDDLMMGKLVGVGAAGLTQMAIWAALLVIAAGSQFAVTYGIHGLSSLGVTTPELAFFAVFFLLGFYLYSALAAALGSTVSGEQDVQQFSLILISPLVVSVILMPYVMANPASTMSVVLSLIPPFTPIILYIRICAQMPPVWQIALGIALLAATVWGMIWLAARIYRIGVLMYGKRATLPEIVRWLRYS